MLDRKRLDAALETKLESGMRRDARKAAKDSMRISEDGRGKPFWFVGDSLKKRRKRRRPLTDKQKQRIANATLHI